MLFSERVNDKSNPGWWSNGSYKAVSPSATAHETSKAVSWCPGELFKVTSLSAPNWPSKFVLSTIMIKHQKLCNHLQQSMDHQNVIYTPAQLLNHQSLSRTVMVNKSKLHYCQQWIIQGYKTTYNKHDKGWNRHHITWHPDSGNHLLTLWKYSHEFWCSSYTL